MSFEQRERILDFFERADKALSEGLITKKERDAFLTHHCNTTDKEEALRITDQEVRGMTDGDGRAYTVKTISLMTGFFVIMMTLFAAMFYTTGGITGAVILNISVDQTYTGTNSLPFQIQNATSITITGTIVGTGNANITIVHDGTTYPMYSYEHGSITTPHASLPKQVYTPNETVAFSATGVESTYLLSDNTTLNLGNTTILENLSIGNYTINLLINGTNITLEQLTFSVVENLTIPTETFSTCGSLCETNITGNATINITIDGGAVVTLTQILLGQQTNSPPTLLTTIPDMTATDHLTIDLTTLFSDPDNDTLYYSSSDYTENTETITNGTLTITGVPGTYSYLVYASDLKELVSSNLFTITFVGNTTILENLSIGNYTINPLINGTNSTTNTSRPEPNITSSTGTTNQNTTPVNNTNTTTTLVTTRTVPASSCANPDPNKRPVDCLLNSTTNYFQEQTIYITNTARTPVARISPIGNLLLTGGLQENELFSPKAGDYTIGYEDNNGNYVATVWFESATGTLHLRGGLTEEELEMSPPAGSFVLRNRKGITLAWADPTTGEFHIRGNIIPYRRSIT